jgi:transposase
MGQFFRRGRAVLAALSAKGDPLEAIDRYNLLYRWFVGLGVDDPIWVPTVFTRNRDRLLAAKVAHKFLAELLAHRDVRDLLSNDHFSVDGTQV